MLNGDRNSVHFAKTKVGIERIDGRRKRVAGETDETKRTKGMSFDLDSRDVLEKERRLSSHPKTAVIHEPAIKQVKLPPSTRPKKIGDSVSISVDSSSIDDASEGGSSSSIFSSNEDLASSSTGRLIPS